MLDVISVGLRAGMLELYTPRQDGPLLLDEVDKYIADDEMVQAMGEFLRQYSHGSGRQVIIITHKAGLMAYGDKNFDFRPGPGLTCVVDTSDND
jgi:DNA repair ATPase RecN